jgi:valyl-tRNA synthetase
MRVGRRLSIKILNASKFVLGMAAGGGEVTEPLDRAMLARLASVVTAATAAFEGYQYHQALERSETFFWAFCDDYLELVKSRAYGSADGSNGAPTESARAALALALSVQLRLLAPFLPFVTEEVWSWWKDGSVHRAAWPSASELPVGADPSVLDAVAEALAAVRRTKTAEKRSLRAPVARLVIVGSPERLAAITAASGDLRAAGNVRELVQQEGTEPNIQVELAPDEG